jgi:hypothetical protein
MVSATFCCVQCRLLQPPGTACAECDAPMTAPVELVRELLYYRDMQLVNKRDWGLVTAFLAGSSLALPILAPFAVGSLLALGAAKLRDLRRRQAIAGVSIPLTPPAAGATTVYGTARRFRGTVRDAVLLEHVAIRDRHGAVLLRRTEARPFFLETSRGPILVAGAARVVPPSFVAERSRVRRDDARLREMGVPVDFAVAGDLEVAHVTDGADMLAVTGMLADETIAELAFHRDGGSIPVMRGVAGAPLLVEDRRLRAAALT